jgi:hypothetical protein
VLVQEAVAEATSSSSRVIYALSIVVCGVVGSPAAMMQRSIDAFSMRSVACRPRM